MECHVPSSFQLFLRRLQINADHYYVFANSSSLCVSHKFGGIRLTRQTSGKETNKGFVLLRGFLAERRTQRFVQWPRKEAWGRRDVAKII